MKKISVCHITSMHAQNDDRIFERACVALANYGFDTSLIVTHPKPEQLDGVRIVPLKKRKGIKRRILSSIEAYKKAKKEVQADIYHFHDPDLLFWMYLLKRKGKKVVYDIHENYRARFYQNNWPKLFQKTGAYIYDFLEKWFIKRFDGIVTTTHSMYTIYKKCTHSYCIVQNVPDLTRLQHININQEKFTAPTIYTSGTNSSARNCDSTLEALPLILKTHPNTEMIFAGRYYPESYKSNLSEKGKQLGCTQNLKLLDMLPWDKNFERTAKASIGCVFYENNLNNQVTTPNRLFEYMFCGVPVLAHDFPELRHIVEETQCGILVDSNDPQSIAEGINKLFENPSLMKEMGENGRKAVMEQYNFNEELHKLIDFYISLIRTLH